MASDENVEIIVIGDVYWDTVIFPLPSDHNNTDRTEKAFVRMDRPAGALLLENLIRKATELDPSIKVKGYGTAKNCYKNTEIETLHAFRTDDDLKPDKCRRALTVMGRYSKSDKEEEKVYRIGLKQDFGWVAYPGECEKKYTVQPDDTLLKIAETEYGDGKKYNRIVEANKLLLPSLNKIKPDQKLNPGQELRIPRSWASNEKDNREPVFANRLNKDLKATLEESDHARRIVVISETETHIFRQLSKNVEFVEEITRSPNTSLVFCMAHPLGEGALWNMIKENKDIPGLVDRTLVIISATSLRAGELYVREQAAQETMALELARKFVKTKIQDLNQCPHIVVRFDYDVVFHYDTRQKYFDNYLRPFDGGPRTNPGRYGTMSGYGKILVASVVKEMAEGIKTENEKPFDRLGKGICDGLRRGAAHFRNGFAAKGFEDNYLTKGEEPTPFENLFKNCTSENSTPIKELFRQSYIDDDGAPKLKEKVDDLPLLAKVHMPCDAETLEKWSRVEGLKKEIIDKNKTFESCLIDVVKIGLRKALERHKTNVSGLSEDEWPIACPFLKLGDLVSVERKELDGFNDVYVLIQKYLQNDSWKKPLSLGVFGPPGTGKSFAVKEILKAAGSASAVELEYNLSGFTEPKNLARAFHKAQDVGLSGKVPLVFFDEFDASLPGRPYAWLKYFLAPMQDGKFKAAESEDSYTVGRAIFVFAGGTADTFEKFVRNVRKEKSAKGPDFISRLRGHLNILSINDEPGKPPKEPMVRELVQAIGRLAQTINKSSAEIDEDTEEHPKDKSKAEPIENCRLLLRRAIILRSVLEREASEILDGKENARIDDGVINAFLWIDRYEHGTRSMEAIVKMARPDNGWLRVASLPSADQLGMYVNDELFLGLARGDEPLPKCSFPSETASALNPSPPASGIAIRRAAP